MEDYSRTELKAECFDRFGTLNLEGKRLSRVPDAVTELSEVQHLMLKDNSLTELPTTINKLNRLLLLHLDGKNLTELPAEIGDLKELRWLSVSNNQLVGLPTSIQKLNRLRAVSYTHLTLPTKRIV